MTRPSIHRPLTKSYAIDQITDIEQLRRVTHRMWEAFSASHKQSAHIFGALTAGDGCAQCHLAFVGDGEPCQEYRDLQTKVSDGFGSV